MAVPEVKTVIIKDKPFSETLSKEEAWRMIYDDAGEVTHLFKSSGRTITPGRMKCFETNEDAGLEVESKHLKCYKAVVSDNNIVESLTSEKVNISIIGTKPTEKIFYSADLTDFEMYAQEQKWDTSKVKDNLPSATKEKEK